MLRPAHTTSSLCRIGVRFQRSVGAFLDCPGEQYVALGSFISPTTKRLTVRRVQSTAPLGISLVTKAPPPGAGLAQSSQVPVEADWNDEKGTAGAHASNDCIDALRLLSFVHLLVIISTERLTSPLSMFTMISVVQGRLTTEASDDCDPTG
jgi:hypothetical protein